MIVAAVICTLLGGVLGAYLEPVSFAISIPIANHGRLYSESSQG